MKSSTAVITGALVMLLGACGSNAPKTPAPPAAQASTPAATPAPDLNSELLSVSDLPAGWSVAPSSTSNSGVPQCLQNAKTDLKPVSKAEASFAGGSNGLPELDELLSYVPGEGRHAITVFSQILGRCGRISMTSDGQTLTGTVGAMSFPAVADQSAAYQMNLSATVSGVTLTFGIDLVAFRKADTAAIILYGDLGTPDIQTVQSLVQAAAAKLS